MKKFIGTIILGLLWFSSCNLFFNSGDNNENSVLECTSPNKPIYISNHVDTVIVNGVRPNQKVYLNSINDSSSLASSRAIKTVSKLNINKKRSISEELDKLSVDSLCNHYTDNIDFNAVENLFSGIAVRASYVQDFNTPVPQKNYKKGDAKFLWVMTDVVNNKYNNMKVECVAKGTYCYVWCPVLYKDRIADNSADILAAKFDKMYPVIRNVFGEESDKILYPQKATFGKWAMENADMTYLSDVGTKVNLVLENITNGTGSGILGFFSGNDYFPNSETLKKLINIEWESGNPMVYSNEGKYLYIDLYFLENVSRIKSCISIVAHEFQHMIHWGNKYMKHRIQPETAVNEMLSMLCEDCMRQFLQIDYDDSVFAERLPGFNASYFFSGLEYRKDSDGKYTIDSYQTNYAFGAWLLRKYGGVALLKEMSLNKATGIDSIINAVKKTHGNIDVKTLLLDFAYDCTIKGTPDSNGWKKQVELSAENPLYFKSLSDSYGYILESLDLWNLDNILTPIPKCKYDGPLLLYADYRLKKLRPYGMELVKIGTTTDTSFVLKLSASDSDSVHCQLIIE